MAHEIKIKTTVKQGHYKDSELQSSLTEPLATFYEMETTEGLLIPMVRIAGNHKPFMLSQNKARSVLELAEYLKNWVKS